MNKDVILSRAGDQLIECEVLYIGDLVVNDKTRRGLVYLDKERTRRATAAEMKEAFLKRCVLVSEDEDASTYTPIMYYLSKNTGDAFFWVKMSDTYVALISAESVPS